MCSPEWEQVCHVGNQPQVRWLGMLFEAEGGTDVKSRMGFLTETPGAFQAHDGVRDAGVRAQRCTFSQGRLSYCI